MTGEWKVRDARRDECAALSDLAHAAKAACGYEAAWLAAWAHELTFTPAYVDAHRVFVVDDPDEPPTISGVCALEQAAHTWAIAHLWVRPTHQRRGIGASLVRHALAIVAATRPGIVRVSADPNALDFYCTLGAQRAGVRTAPMPGAPDRTLPQLTFDVNPVA